MEPGASGNGVRTATASDSAPGPGVALHAYDIGVLVVYFVFVIGVGVWVSRPRGWGLAGETQPCSHLLLVTELGTGVGRRQAGQGATGAGVEGPSGISLANPPFLGGQTETQEGL